MGERGIDVSEWQAGMDAERVSVENGLSFAMVRTNYGSNHDDLQFHRFCDGFERAGVIVTPYCYPLATDTQGSVDDAERIIGGRYDRLIIDWEHGSGGGDHLRRAHDRAWDHGFYTPLVYDPAWYWQQQGSPNVDWMGQSGRIRGHWKSWYPDNIVGSFEAILAKLAAYVWDDNRGGIPTEVVQFSSSVILKGWGGKVDANYFRGNHAQLSELLEGNGMNADDVLELESPGSRARGENPVYTEDVPLRKAVGDSYFYSTDSYRLIHEVLLPALEDQKTINAALQAKLDQIETGAISDEKLAEIVDKAKKAVGGDLTDDSK